MLEIDRAKARIVLRHPWWATLLLNLQVVESLSLPTAATDGTYLIINPNWIRSLSSPDLDFVLMHEAAHCALLHPFRRKWREPCAWNVACDAAANALLVADGLSLPAGAIPPAPLGMIAEDLYKVGEKLGQALQDVLSPGEFGPKNSPLKQSERKWREILSAVHGLAPASFQRVLGEAVQPLTDWRTELTNFISSKVKDQVHTWNRPSRRVKGFPGWKTVPSLKLALCIDTSGSISSALLTKFRAEVEAILGLYGVQALCLSADAALQQIVEPGEPLPNVLVGGGGTDFQPVFRYLETSSTESIDAVIYFTDGDGDYPLKEPSVSVMWVLSKRTGRKPPWGNSIYLEDANEC